MRRQDAIRRTDLFACGALLLAGLCAQGAMWSAGHQSVCRWAAPLFLAVTLLVAWQRSTAPGPTVRFGLQLLKLVACSALVAISVSTGALSTLQHGAHRPSTTTSIGALLLVVQLVQAATVTTRRDLALSAPVTCAMLTQAGMAARNCGPAPAFAAATALLVIGVALVFRGELLEEATVVAQPPAGGSSASANGSFVGAVASPLMRVSALGAVVFLLLPNSFHLSVRPAADKSRTSTGSPDSDAADGKNDVHSRALADPATGYLDLRVRGRLADTPVFVTDSQSPAYWQGAVYDNYDGVTWTMTGPSPAGDWTVAATGSPAAQTAPADPDRAAGGPTQTRTDSVQVVAAQPLHAVFAPGRAMSYLGPGRVSADADGNPRLVVTGDGPPSSRDYDVVSTRPVTSGASTSSGSDLTDPRWKQLPAELPSRVAALAHQLTAGARTRADAVAAVDDYLRSHETYDLSAPLPAPGEDSVDSFLFQSHQGFCEQFATAAVVLLRASGIPTRLVTGYSQGDVATEPGKRIMRGVDAHAWVQVWYPGVGWVDNDPTASAVLGGAIPQQASASASTRPSASEAGVVSSLPSPHASPAATVRSAKASTLGGRLLLAGALVVLVGVARLVVSIGRRARRRKDDAEPSVGVRAAGGPVLQAYLRLDDALAATGRPRSPGDTPRDIPRRLGSAASAQPTLAMAIDLLERECYGIEPLSDAQTRTAVDVLDSFVKSVKSAVSVGAENGTSMGTGE